MKRPDPIVGILAVIEEQRLSGLPDEEYGYFDSYLVRMAMVWARRKGFEEAEAIARREFGGPENIALACALKARWNTPPLVNVGPRTRVQ
jgi:hypothetical protein